MKLMIYRFTDFYLLTNKQPISCPGSSRAFSLLHLFSCLNIHTLYASCNCLSLWLSISCLAARSRAPLSISCCRMSAHSVQANVFGSSKTIFFCPLQNSCRSAVLYAFLPSFSATWQNVHPLGHPRLMKP